MDRGMRRNAPASLDFFAVERFRSILHVDENFFRIHGLDRRMPPGVSNPLALLGLVLAGADRPSQDPEHEGGGILTAEAIAGLPLSSLELVVLSACDTGRRRVADGEGVFGLQRAFHLAGARNVVASLWAVDDATAVLKKMFYRKRRQEHKPPTVAMREAQLYLYHHPEVVREGAQHRGPNFATEEPLPSTLPRAVS